MTTDTDALQERLWDAIYASRSSSIDNEAPTIAIVAAVLPIIDAEVRAAKIEAWQEGVNFALPNAETTWYPQHNPYRATGYETGDQA